MFKKKQWYDALILVALYLLSRTEVFYNQINNMVIVFLLKSLLIIIFLVFYFIYTRKNGIKDPTFAKFKKNQLLVLPLFIVVFSNIFVALITSSPRVTPINYTSIFLGMALNLLGATAEELVFRVTLLMYFMTYYKPWKALLYSSLIFGIVHVVNISSLASIPLVISQVFYTLFLGLGAGLLYLVTNNFLWPLGFHFLFNFVNGTLAENLFALTTDVSFYLISFSVTLVAVLYGFYIFKTTNPKGELQNVTDNLDF